MAKRYIDADRLKEAFHTDTEHLQSRDEHLFDLIMIEIDEAPTADVKEVKRGKWYRHNKKEHGDTCYYCSVCEKMALSDCLEWELTEFCPRCGADMRGEEDG